MNEEEWLIGAKPDLMLVHLQRQVGFRALRRKIRLFLCACRRLGWELNTTGEEHAAIELAERFVDGQATHAERDTAREKLISSYLRYQFARRSLVPDALVGRGFPGVPLLRAIFGSEAENIPQLLAIFACEADNRLGDRAFQATALLVRTWTEAALGPNAHQRPGSEWKQCQAKHRTIVGYLLRDIFGNPFRGASVDSHWLVWNDGTVPRLAQAIYDERAFDRLSILADALEEAGCTDADILNHCRQPGEHVRGCWVVDLLLGKH